MSPQGGSGKLISWVKEGRIGGVVSELIVDEVLRNAERVGITQKKAIITIDYFRVIPAPQKKVISQYESIVVDFGDTHVLASSVEAKAEYLVTLDKKHLLILATKLKHIAIVTPGQFIEQYSGKVTRLKI